MYRIPLDLDLSAIIGQTNPQIRVGQFDIQFSFGKVNFAVQSQIVLRKDGKQIGGWEQGVWPDEQFYSIMNSAASSYQVVNDRLLEIHLENGIEICLKDDSDQFECLKISIEGEANSHII